MRKIAFAIPFVLAAGAAVAADMPRGVFAPPPPVVQAPGWTGFYIGGNVGWGWANASTDAFVGNLLAAGANTSISGLNGGGQLGYNWQSGAMLLGLETDFQFANLRGSVGAACFVALCPGAATAGFSQSIPWFGTARGRLGYATDSWIAYVTGGYAYTRYNVDASATAGPFIANFSTGDIRSGWTVGTGVEVAFAPRWSAKLEYLYMDFGTTNTSSPAFGPLFLTSSTRLNENVARVGVNYRF